MVLYAPVGSTKTVSKQEGSAAVFWWLSGERQCTAESKWKNSAVLLRGVIDRDAKKSRAGMGSGDIGVLVPEAYERPEAYEQEHATELVKSSASHGLLM
jgi:hypothetical protein